MERAGFTPDLRARVFTALTGRPGDTSGRTSGDVREMLLAGYGLGRRGGVDTRAAAAGLGVTQRTVQRWLATEGRQRSTPSPGHLRAIATRARQSASTQRGRRAALVQARRGSLPRYGAKLSIRGHQGPARAGRDYRRLRRLDLVLAASDVTAALDAYERGGDRAFVGWLENYADQEYVNDWGFASIDGIDFGDPRERR